MQPSKSKPHLVTVLGMTLLAIASTGQWYLQRHSGLPEDTADFASGLLYGIAIGTLLLGIWALGREKARRARGESGGRK